MKASAKSEPIEYESEHPLPEQEATDLAPDQDQIFWELIVPTAVDAVWKQVEPLLRQSIEWSPTIQKMEAVIDIKGKCLNDVYKLWCCFRNGSLIAVLVTGVARHSRALVIDIHYGAGGEKLLVWMGKFYKLVAADARAAGVRFFRVTGRKEWKAALSRHGFKEEATVFMLEM